MSASDLVVMMTASALAKLVEDSVEKALQRSEGRLGRIIPPKARTGSSGMVSMCQAARIAGVRYAEILAAAESGDLKATKTKRGDTGHRWHVLPSDVQEWAAKRVRAR